MKENTNPELLYRQLKTHGEHADEHRLKLIRSLILHAAIDEDGLLITNDLAQHPEIPTPDTKRINNRHESVSTYKGHLSIPSRLTTSELISAAEQISRLMENTVGFAITSRKGTYFVGSFNPDVKRDIIYLRALESD